MNKENHLSKATPWLYALACLFVLCACRHQPEHTVACPHCMTIAIDSLNNLPKDSLKEIRYVPLETRDDILISHIGKTIYAQGCYHIFDFVSKKIQVFNKQGRFVYSIDKIGQGPGEYTSILDMDVSSQGDVYVVDSSKSKIIKYSSQGTQFEEYNIGKRCMEFAALNDSIFYLANLIDDGKMEVALARYSTVSKNTEVLSAYDVFFEGNIFRFGTSFHRTGESVYFNKMFSPEISRISETGADSYINLPSSRWVSGSVIEKWKKDKKTSDSEDRELLRGVSAFYETADYSYINLQSMPPLELLVDKTTGEVSTPVYFTGKVRSFNGIRGVAGPYLISSTPSAQENIHYILEHDPDMLPEERTALSKLAEEDNPVLLLLKF